MYSVFGSLPQTRSRVIRKYWSRERNYEPPNKARARLFKRVNRETGFSASDDHLITGDDGFFLSCIPIQMERL